MPYPTRKPPNEWIYFVLNGMVSPGTIPRGGVKGFGRATGWDIKRGKGTRGATLTLKDQPPCEGSITLQLIGPGGLYFDGSPSHDFADWDAFVAGVLSTPVTQQAAQGLGIYYPGFSAIDLSAVVIKHYSTLDHVGRGLYHVTIQMIEWSPPLPKSIVSTVASTKPDAGGGGKPAPPHPEDPRISALKAQIAAALKAATP